MNNNDFSGRDILSANDKPNGISVVAYGPASSSGGDDSTMTPEQHARQRAVSNVIGWIMAIVAIVAVLSVVSWVRKDVNETFCKEGIRREGCGAVYAAQKSQQEIHRIAARKAECLKNMGPKSAHLCE